jgi:hypothetical protein
LNTNISYAYRISSGYKAITSRYFTSRYFTPFHCLVRRGEGNHISKGQVREGVALPHPAPDIALADQAHQKDTLFRVIPGSFQAPIHLIRIGFPGFCGGCVHAHDKYHLKRVFSKNTQFKRFLNLLNSGVPVAYFFRINGLYRKAGKTSYIALGMEVRV